MSRVWVAWVVVFVGCTESRTLESTEVHRAAVAVGAVGNAGADAGGVGNAGGAEDAGNERVSSVVRGSDAGLQARATGSGPVLVDPAPVATFQPGAPSTGFACFTWRRGHSSSSQCYGSIESCNAERRAVGPVETVTRCEVHAHVVCTRITGGDREPGRHCFGDAARCAQFREELGTSSFSTPCVTN